MKPISPKIISYTLMPLQGEALGFAQIGKLYDFCAASNADVLMIDCRLITTIDAYMTAGYAAIIALLKTIGKTVHFINRIPSKVKETVIPVTRFAPGEGKKFAQYTQDHFVNVPMPNMSEKVLDKFFEGLDEIFCNSEIHSKTKNGIFVCGQSFPQKDKVDFAIVDLGIGFQSVLKQALKVEKTPDDAIAWAMSGTNTTRVGDIPGGLGLKILKGFIKLNGGRLSVISHRGHWCLGPGGIVQGTVSSLFPGTAVTLEINTADKKSYYMEEEAQSWGSA